MNDNELKLVKKKQQQTTERSLSEYIRTVSMQKPVTIKYRNQSADDFFETDAGVEKRTKWYR